MGTHEKYRESNALAEISRQIRQAHATAATQHTHDHGATQSTAAPAQQAIRCPSGAGDDAGKPRQKRIKRKQRASDQGETAYHAALADIPVGGAEDLPELAGQAPGAGLSAQQRSEDPGGMTFRDVYLNSFMSDFGNELEEFGSNASGRGRVHMDLLLRCIEAGTASFSTAQQAACLQHLQTPQRHDAPDKMMNSPRAWL